MFTTRDPSLIVCTHQSKFTPQKIRKCSVGTHQAENLPDGTFAEPKVWWIWWCVVRTSWCARRHSTFVFIRHMLWKPEWNPTSTVQSESLWLFFRKREKAIRFFLKNYLFFYIWKKWIYGFFFTRDRTTSETILSHNIIFSMNFSCLV